MTPYKTTPIEKSFLRVLREYSVRGLNPHHVISKIQYARQDNIGEELAKFVLERLVSVGLATKTGKRYFAA